MITQEQASGIMLQLKESTRKLHDATEEGAFNQDLIKGRLPLEAYVDSLAQLLLIHRALELNLRRYRASEPALQRVLRDYQFQEPYLIEDLAFFGRDAGAIVPLAATRELITAIEDFANEDPVALLGVHYVFEGSNNGGRFIARALRRVYKLSENQGTRYLDPYGDKQRDYWQAFKDDMDAVGFSGEESQRLMDAAGIAFKGIMRLHSELHVPVAATSRASPATSGCPFHRL